MSETQFSREPNLVGISIRSDSSYCGILLSRISLPDGCIALGLVRQEKVILASTGPTIHCGDHVLAIALNPMLTPALKVALRQRHRVYYSPNHCRIEPQSSEHSFLHSQSLSPSPSKEKVSPYAISQEQKFVPLSNLR